MGYRNRYRIPPASALVAFESAARLRSFSRAAQELGTFQSAVSRQIATLEKWVSIRLFERSPTGVTLTDAGNRMYGAVATGLGVIHRGVAEAEEFSKDEQVVIACSHETSQFVLLPRYNALCEALGERVHVRILTFQQDITSLPPDPVADVVFTWNEALTAPQHRVQVMKEAVRPVCSPEYAARHAADLNGPVAGWDTQILIDYTRSNEGWATWDDWFAVAGRPKRRPIYLGIESYPYVLEAAAAGRGIALGWQGFIERHLAAGSLVALGDGFSEFDRHCFCALTEKGQAKALAHKCLAFFEHAPPLAGN